MRRLLRLLPASRPFASVIVFLSMLVSLEARGDATQIRVNEFQTACANGDTGIQFIELIAPTDQTFFTGTSIRILDHAGVSILTANNLFIGQANGADWPAGKTWLIGSGGFAGATGLTPDRVIASPTSILDPVGGTIILRVPNNGGSFTIAQQFTYGSVGGSPAPLPGRSLHRVDDQTYADSSAPDPTTFAGLSATNLNCVASPVVPCPKDTLNGILYGVPTKSAPGSNGTAAYDVPSGHCNANGSAGDMGFNCSAGAVDSFKVIGLTAGTPVDIVARLHAILAAQSWGASYYNPAGVGAANARVRSDAGLALAAVRAHDGLYASLDTTLTLPLHVIAGQSFLLSFGSSIAGGFANATADAQLSFSDLPFGAQVVSCQGYTTDVPTAVAASLSSLDATPDRVRIAWMLADARVSNITLERSGSDQAWATLASLTPDGRGEVTYDDLNVQAGGRYGYRLRILTPQGTVVAGETWVDIPNEARLSLGGAVPNPATDRLMVSFALAGADRATLDLLDIAGRRVIRRDVSAFGAGLHRVDLGSTVGLEPGIYLLRLSQGDHSLVRRISLLH